MKLRSPWFACAALLFTTSARAQLAPPNVVLLNGTGTVSDVVRDVSEIVTAAPESGDRSIFFASVVVNRGSNTLVSKLFRIHPLTATVSDHDVIPADVFGMQGVASTINDTVTLGAPFAAPRTLSLRALLSGATLNPMLGTATEPLPRFACHRDGECIAVHTRAPNAGLTARRFVPSPLPSMTGTPPVDITFGGGVAVRSSIDVAFFHGRALIVWHEGESVSRVFAQWLPPLAAAGAPMPGVISLGDGRAPRVACNESLGGCVIGFLANDGVRSLATATIQSGTLPTQLSPYPAGVSVLSIDVTAIRQGIRVGALMQVSGSNYAIGAADFVGVGGVVSTSQAFTLLPARPPRDLRFETSTESDVTVATWIAGTPSIAQGAVIVPPPPDAGVDAGADAAADASADASDEGDAGAGADSATANDAAVIDPTLRYTGGACACSVAHTQSSSGVFYGQFAVASALVAAALRRRRAART